MTLHVESEDRLVVTKDVLATAVDAIRHAEENHLLHFDAEMLIEELNDAKKNIEEVLELEVEESS